MSSISIKYKGRVHTLAFGGNESVLQVLQENGIPFAAPCGGNGSCGKCTISVTLNGRTQLLPACQTRAQDGLYAEVPDGEGAVCSEFSADAQAYTADGEGCAIAVDLGTTTVAAQLISLSSGKCLGSLSGMNAQKTYGADVISRTQYIMENEGGLERLGGLIRQQIRGMADELCRGAGIDSRAVPLFIAGNTIMQHIYAGLSPASIASAPFTPMTLFDKAGERAEREGFAPCVSGYIGGDITAGMLAVGLHNKEKDCLFIDLGTNGEMALGSKKRIVCCSVASGPAFEGAGISCGMASTAGAISHIEYAGGKFEYETIGGAAAAGICGSGIIELTACLLKLGIIDGSGYLQPPDELDEDFGGILGEDESGNGIVYLTKDRRIYFTARDVRQVQLAKAAVAAGIDILLEEAGIGAGGIDTLYLAGGFGTYIDTGCAALIGMLPEEAAGRVKSAGNTSLAGAAMALCSSEARKALYDLPGMCRYIELSGDRRFNDYFAEHMAFSDDY